MSESEVGWLADLKVGDEVAVPERFGGGYRILKITHTTRTQVHTDWRKFRRNDGWEVGGSTWDRTLIRQVTPTILAEVELTALKNKARLMRDQLAIPQTKEELEALIAALGPFIKH